MNYAFTLMLMLCLFRCWKSILSMNRYMIQDAKLFRVKVTRANPQKRDTETGCVHKTEAGILYEVTEPPRKIGHFPLILSAVFKVLRLYDQALARYIEAKS